MSGDLAYETVVQIEEHLVVRITVAADTIADMPGIFERTRQSMVRRCTCVHTGQWSRIRAIPVNATAVISMLNYLLCNFGPKLYNSVMKFKPELINLNLNTFKNKIISII